jgi:hypothetical protein
MLRFLCLAACLLFASAAFAQSQTCPGASRLIGDMNNDCKLWIPCPQRDETMTWSGDCVGGLVDGRGVLQWFIGGKPDGRYEGTVDEGFWHGRGVYTVEDGTVYEGDFRFGHFHGRGTIRYPNGEWYKGEWRYGSPHGQGTAYVEGTAYTGTWSDGCLLDSGVEVSFGPTEDECRQRPSP